MKLSALFALLPLLAQSNLVNAAPLGFGIPGVLTVSLAQVNPTAAAAAPTALATALQLGGGPDSPGYVSIAIPNLNPVYGSAIAANNAASSALAPAGTSASSVVSKAAAAVT